jgi:hypothetical protein
MDDLAAQIATANEHAAAALHKAAEILAPLPDPAIVLAERELPTLMAGELVDAATRRGPSARGRRTVRKRRHKKHVAKVLAELAREHRRELARIDET